MASSKKTLSLSRNFSWVALGRFSFAIAQWLILILLARLGSTAMLGRYSLALAVTIPIFLFASLQIPVLLATDARMKFRFNEYLHAITLSAMVGFVIVVGIAFWLGAGGEKTWVIIVVGLNRGIENIKEVYFGLFQRESRMDIMGGALVFQSVVGLLGFVIAIAITKNLVISVLVLAAINLLVLLFYVRVKGRSMLADWPADQIKAAWSRVKLLNLSRLGLPLALVALMDALLYMVPRYFIEYYNGEAMLGIFTAFFATLKVGSLVILSLGQASSPRLAAFAADNKSQRFWRLIWRLVGVSLATSVIAVLGVVLLGNLMVPLIFGAPFVPYIPILLLLVFRTFFAFPAAVLRSAAVAARRIRWQPVVLIVALVTDIVSCYLLVPTLALRGASYGLIIATFVLLLGYICIVRAPGLLQAEAKEITTGS